MHIADDIEQFMTCTLVLPLQWTVLDVTQLVGIHVRHLEMVGELVELSLFYLALVDNDGIVQVATLDKVSLEQWHDIANEYKVRLKQSRQHRSPSCRGWQTGC